MYLFARVSILPFSTIFLLDYGTVSTMLYFLFFILLLKVRFLCTFGAPIYNDKIVLFENSTKN